MDYKKVLKISSILEIIMGVCGIAFVMFLLKQDPTQAGITASQAESAFGGVMMQYVSNGLKILAGVLGLVFAKKPGYFMIVLGFGLFCVHFVDFLVTGQSIMYYIVNVILMAIPYFYLSSSYHIHKENK